MANYLKPWFILILLFCFINSCKSQSSNKITIPPKECIELNDKGVKYLMAFPDKDAKKLDSAIIFFDKAIKCDTNYLIAYSNLAGAFERKKNYISEMILYNKVLALTNNDPFYLLRKGVLFEKMDKIDSANNTYLSAKMGFEKKMAVHPTSSLIGGLVLTRALTNGNDSAIKELNEQLKKHPEFTSQLSYEYELYKKFDRNSFIYNGTISNSTLSNKYK